MDEVVGIMTGAVVHDIERQDLETGEHDAAGGGAEAPSRPSDAWPEPRRLGGGAGGGPGSACGAGRLPADVLVPEIPALALAAPTRRRHDAARPGDRAGAAAAADQRHRRPLRHVEAAAGLAARRARDRVRRARDRPVGDPGGPGRHGGAGRARRGCARPSSATARSTCSGTRSAAPSRSGSPGARRSVCAASCSRPRPRVGRGARVAAHARPHVDAAALLLALLLRVDRGGPDGGPLAATTPSSSAATARTAATIHQTRSATPGSSPR